MKEESRAGMEGIVKFAFIIWFVWTVLESCKSEKTKERNDGISALIQYLVNGQHAAIHSCAVENAGRHVDKGSFAEIVEILIQ